MIAVLSDNVIIAMFATIAPTIASIGALIVSWGNRNKAVAAKIASEARDIKIEAVAKTAESVHTLVNSNMGIQLRVAAVALRRVANLTKNIADITAATLAEKMLAEHNARQVVVDAAANKPAAPVIPETPLPHEN